MKLEIILKDATTEELEKILAFYKGEIIHDRPQAQPSVQPTVQPVQPTVQPTVQPPVVQPTVPVTGQIAYTLEQLQTCAASLVHQGKSTQLVELLHALGCNALTEVPKDKYNEFANKLRELGGVL